jgi:hypothetical protein
MFIHNRLSSIVFTTGLCIPTRVAVPAADAPAYGPELEGFSGASLEFAHLGHALQMQTLDALFKELAAPSIH